MAALEAENQALRSELDWFKRQIFGSKSEKRPEVIPGQGALLGLSEEDRTKLESEADKVTITYQRGSGKKQRSDDCQTDQGLRFGPDVPVKRIDIIPDELKGDQASDYEVIDTHYRYKLAQQPAYVVIEYALPVIRRKSDDKLKTTAMPPQVLDSSLADVSFLAGMLVDKFAYHLPMYRQHQRLLQGGITLARSTLTNLTKRSIDLLRPIVDAQLESVLRSRVLAMDETPVKAGRKPKAGKQPGKMKQGWYWPLYGDADEIVFTYSNSRGRQHIESVLKDRFTGVLVSDGYSAYASYTRNMENITHAQCWVHTRRQYLKAESAYPELVSQILGAIASLYTLEKQSRALEGDEKLGYRQANSKPIVDNLFKWCTDQLNVLTLTPKDPLQQALTYTLKREASLRAFLNDAEVPLDTNHLERGLRPIPMGRKNWLFCWTEVGAEQVGIIQSLIATCQLQGIDPMVYLVDVLQRVSEHPAKRVEELTPRLWKDQFMDNPKRPPLHQAENHAH